MNLEQQPKEQDSLFQIDPDAAQSNNQDSYSHHNHQYLNDYQLNEPTVPSSIYTGGSKAQRISIGHKQDSDGKSKGGDSSIHRSSKRGHQYTDDLQNDSRSITHNDSYQLDSKDQAAYHDG